MSQTPSSVTQDKKANLEEADDFDRQFFAKKEKVKLTKDQKRQLKFMLKRGDNVEEVEDLKRML